jgi:hypothetical protein
MQSRHLELVARVSGAGYVRRCAAFALSCDCLDPCDLGGSGNELGVAAIGVSLFAVQGTCIVVSRWCASEISPQIDVRSWE